MSSVMEIAMKEMGDLIAAAASPQSAIAALRAETVTGFVNVKEKFGAKGDGIADDTAAVKAAIEHLTTSFQDADFHWWNGGVLYFPPGVYLITEPLIATMNIKFLGLNINTWKVYDAIDSASVLRFKFTDKQQSAIRFTGYKTDGSLITDYYITTPESAFVVGPPENVAMENIVVESDPNGVTPILLGVNMMNTPNARMVNVAIRGFKYGILANCNWGASFDKIFILCRYGGIINYESANGVSINDSYITVSGNVIPVEDVIVPLIATGDFPNKSFGLLVYGGIIEIKNVIIEQCRVAVKGYGTRINANLLHTENIQDCIAEMDASLLNLNLFRVFNNPATAVTLLKAINSSRVSIRGTSTNVTNSIDASDNCTVVTTNCQSVSYVRKTPIIPLDATISDLITFDAGVLVDAGTGNVNRYAYRNGRTVFLNIKVYTAAPITSGVTVTVGTIPIGFRPFVDVAYMTRYGKVLITTLGVITILMTTTNEFILNETMTYII